MEVVAYYQLNGGPVQVSQVQQDLDEFGIEVPVGTSGLLQAQVFGYNNNVLCSLASGSGSVQMPGEYRQNLSIPLQGTSSKCTAATEPAAFPMQHMAVWAASANDVWLVGDGGKILRWNGTDYTTVPLPATFQQSPPTWNAIIGQSTNGADDVWIAGTSNSVVHYSNQTLTAISVVNSSNGGTPTPTDWQGLGYGDPVTQDVWFAGTSGVFGFTNSTKSQVANLQFVGTMYSNGSYTTPVAITADLNAVSCFYGSLTYYPCFFVGAAGTILQYYPFTVGTTETTALIYASPNTNDYTGVFVGADIQAGQLDVRIVGKAGTVLRSTATISPPTDPDFTAATADYSMYLPQGTKVDFGALGGTGLNDIWIAGQNGVLLQWQDTADPPPSSPFVQSMTGISAEQTSLSSIGPGNGVFTAGGGPTLLYSGKLFTPMP
jgi:hypothetical protein